MADITGTQGDDQNNVKGTNKADTINALGGDDIIEAGKSNGPGDDIVNAGAGDDAVYGKSSSAVDLANPTKSELLQSTDSGSIDGSNILNGDDGDDIIVGRERADTIHGDNDVEGTIEFASRNKVSYEDVPETLQNFEVTGFGPEGASDAVVGENNEGIGVGNKTVDYLYSQGSQAAEGTPGDAADYEGGEILTFDVGTTAKSGSITTRNLDSGEKVKITAFNNGKEVGSFVFEGQDEPSAIDPKIEFGQGTPNSFGAETIFDSVSIEALPGDGPTLNKSTSFNVKAADFTTVASGNDTIVGGGGDDDMKGGYGNDLFIESGKGGAGSDDIDGGAGSDTVDYSGNSSNGVAGNIPGLVVNLSDDAVDVGTDRTTDQITVNNVGVLADDNPGGQEWNSNITVQSGQALQTSNNKGSTTGKADVDTLTSIENIIGTDEQDVIIGSDVKNKFEGGESSDHLSGEGGNDHLKGEEGNDILLGGDGEDKLKGGEGDDTLDGGEGNDRLVGGLGNDAVNGGAGTDTYKVGGGVSEDGGVTMNLRLSNLAEIDRDGDGVTDEVDTLTSIENVVGTRGDDKIIGDSADNTIKGGRGDDQISGGNGDDTIVGGLGDDRLNGSNGRDDTYVVGGRVSNDGGLTLDMSSLGTSGAGETIGGPVEAKIDRDGDGIAEETDIIRNFENVRGTKGDDTITGSQGDNTIKSGRGDDVLDGGEGADVLIAGKGNDILVFDEDDFADASTRDRRFKTGVDTNDDGKINGKDRVEAEHITDRIYSGGQGYDVLQVSGDADVNMLGKGIGGIEAVVATDTGTAQTVSANLNEIRRESDDASAARDKGFDTFTVITGNDTGDSLNLYGNGWTLAGNKNGSQMGNAQATPTNKEDFLGQKEIDQLDKALGDTNRVTMQNGLTAVDGDKLNVFVFEKSNGTFVTVWTDLTADDITLNGVELGDLAIA